MSFQLEIFMNLDKIHNKLHILSHKFFDIFKKLIRNSFLFQILQFLALGHRMFSIEDSNMRLFNDSKLVTLLVYKINILFDQGNICRNYTEIVIFSRCPYYIQSSLSFSLLILVTSSIVLVAVFILQFIVIRLQNFFISFENSV